MTTPTHLYRFFGTDDQLLYVGVTHHPSGRFSQHQKQKPWHEIRRIDLEHYPDRPAAESAERTAIQTERPLWNVVHAGQKPIGEDLKIIPPGGLVGHYFHTFHREDDGCELVNWQGQVIALVEPGFYLVELFEWLIGSTYNRKIVALQDMTDWSFYDDAEWMNNTYRNDLEHRSDRHAQHKGSK